MNQNSTNKYDFEKSSQFIFYDVIPTYYSIRNPVVGSLAKSDLKDGLRIKIIGYLTDGVRKHTATVTSSKPIKSKNGGYEIEVVMDYHFRLYHSDQEFGDFSKCCYRELSLRDIGILPQSNGNWKSSIYTLAA